LRLRVPLGGGTKNRWGAKNWDGDQVIEKSDPTSGQFRATLPKFQNFDALIRRRLEHTWFLDRPSFLPHQRGNAAYQQTPDHGKRELVFLPQPPPEAQQVAGQTAAKVTFLASLSPAEGAQAKRAIEPTKGRPRLAFDPGPTRCWWLSNGMG